MSNEPIPWEGPFALESNVPQPDPDKAQRWLVRPYGDAKMTIVKNASGNPDTAYNWEVYVLGAWHEGSSCRTFPLAQAYAKNALAACARELFDVTCRVAVA